MVYLLWAVMCFGVAVVLWGVNSNRRGVFALGFILTLGAIAYLVIMAAGQLSWHPSYQAEVKAHSLGEKLWCVGEVKAGVFHLDISRDTGMGTAVHAACGRLFRLNVSEGVIPGSLLDMEKTRLAPCQDCRHVLQRFVESANARPRSQLPK